MLTKYLKYILINILLILIASPAFATDDSYAIAGSGGNNAGGQTAQADQFTGAVTYNIPIPVPPARGSVQPQLSLDYNSHRKNANSWVGYGWEMDLGAIERMPFEGEIDYVEGLHYQARLSGQTQTLELVSAKISNASDYGITVPSGALVDRYRAKIQSAYNFYFRIYYEETNITSSTPNMDEGWIVIDKSGTRYEYGTVENAREQFECFSGQPLCGLKIAKWHLKKVTDTNQNTMEVTYDSNRNIQQIEYQDITIDFTTEQHNRYPVYRQSFVPQSGYKLTRVLIKSNGTLLQRFDFGYTESSYNGLSFLSSIQQLGPSGTADLPATTFEYYDESNIAWSSTSYDRQASVNQSGLMHKGFLDYYLTFIDMNGDGLKDKVVAYENSATIHVFYNDGNDFVYVAGKSDWTDPLGANVCDSSTMSYRRCEGQLTAIYNEGANQPRQWVYLMDINGDTLPDRIKGLLDESVEPHNGSFEVYLNEGTRWSSMPVIWDDPALGRHPGTSDNENVFLDLNGDGLIDRVTASWKEDDPSQNDGFLVYFNDGTQFSTTATFWADPAVDIDADSGCIGFKSETYYYSADGGGQYCDIRDFNGDGLPDRLYKMTLADGSGTGWAIYLNLNGEQWAETQYNSSGGLSFDGHEIIFVVDNQTGNPGYITRKQDLIDMNGDGYLDLVRGRPDDGEFDVYFYNGMDPSLPYSEYKNPTVLTDPVIDPYTDDWNGKGYITNSRSGNTHTLLMDIDGDGFPDRVSFDPKNTDENTTRVMKVYPLQMNAVEFSETSLLWNNPNVNQPAGKLKGVDTGTGSVSKVEYLPSTWPKRWSTNFSGLPLNHRFLPFNMWLGFKTYALDYSLTTTETGPEASRYPGMRWTRQDYYGGNYYIRTPSNGHDYFKQFNGFQTVTITTQKGVTETWKDFSNTTVFHQTIGDVNPVDPADDVSFDMTAYGHFALAGKPFYKITEEDGINLSTEVSAYTVLNASGDFECNQPNPCIPQLATQTKTVREPSATNTRTTQVVFEYDEWNNPTVQTHKDSSGNILIVQETEYYDYTDFISSLRLRDRPYIQRKTDGSTTYKYKEFAYDSVGNPVEEKWQVTSADMATVTRQFNSNGTVKQMTDADGVTKYFTYDTDGLFPITETVYLPSGTPLSTQRWYNRVLGKPYKEVGPTGIGKNTLFDEYGRPKEEYLIDSTGTQHKIKWYEYEFVDVSINGWTGYTVSKTRIWNPVDDYTDTNTLAAKISYADAAGGGLQSCALAENAQYRMVQTRSENGGRTDIKTHPIFDSSCNFEGSLIGSTLKTTSYKDLQGRTLYTQTPGSDPGSPVDVVRHDYSITSDGLFQKVSTDSSGKTIVKKFDDFERLKSVTDQIGMTLNYAYDVVGNLLSVKQNGTLLTTVDYDVMGRKTQMWDANLGTWNYYYDSKGRMDYQTDNKGNKVQFHYDIISRIIKKEYFNSDGSLDRFEEYLYDSGDSSHDVLPGEKYAIAEYDADGNEIRKTRFGYTTQLRKTNIITRTVKGLGELSQTFTYNTKGVLLSTKYPGGESLYHKYARTGAVEKLCSQNTCNEENNELYFYLNPNDAYDSYGSILKEYYGNGVQNNYVYYTNTHRLKTKTIQKGDKKYSERNYTYDVYTNLLNIEDTTSLVGSGGIKNIVYDDLSRLTSYTPQDQTIAKTFTHVDNGNLLTNSYSYGTKTYEYTSAKPHAVTKIGDENFTYDDNGNMLTDGSRAMEYNASNQLTRVTMKNGTIVDFEYDFTGARVKKHVHRQDAYNHVMENTTYYLGEALEIKDDNIVFHIFANKKKIATKKLGSIDDIIAGTGSTAALKNIQPEFRVSQTTPFVLLGFGLFFMFSMRPVRKTHLIIARRSKFLEFVRKLTVAWSAYANAFQETLLTLNQRKFAKALSFALVLIFIAQSFTMQPAFASTMSTQIQAQKGSEPGFYYYHGDHLGSAHVITEGETKAKHAGFMYNKGDLIQRIEYHPYGQEKFVLNPNIKLDPSFTGQTYDVSTGLYYYKARYYNPKLARFIQADTLIPSSKDLQSYNRYTYVRSNPLKYTDPSGHSFWSVFKKIGAVFLGALAGVLIGALMFTALAPASGWVAASLGTKIMGGALAGMIGGAAGGLISGAIMGGLQGAMLGLGFGMLTGFVTGGLFQGVNAGFSKALSSKFAGKALEKAAGLATKATIGSIGLGLSAYTNGWEGVATFAAGLLGSLAGGGIAKSVIQKNVSKENSLESFYDEKNQNISSYKMVQNMNKSTMDSLSDLDVSLLKDEKTFSRSVAQLLSKLKYEIFHMDNYGRNAQYAFWIGAGLGAVVMGGIGLVVGSVMAPGVGTALGLFVDGIYGFAYGGVVGSVAWWGFHTVGSWLINPVGYVAPWCGYMECTPENMLIEVDLRK